MPRVALGPDRRVLVWRAAFLALIVVTSFLAWPLRSAAAAGATAVSLGSDHTCAVTMRRLTVLAAMVIALLAVSTAWALSTSQDFDAAGAPFVSVHVPSFGAVTTGPTGPPAVTAADGFSSGQFMRILSGGLFTRTANTVAIDQTDAGTFNRIVADFDFRITCSGARTGFSGGGCADGFAFVFLDTATFGATGLNAGGTPVIFEAFGRSQLRTSPYTYIPNNSFAVSFSTFINDPNSTALLFNNGFISGSVTPIDDLTLDFATGTFGVSGDFHHAHIEMVLAGPTPNLTMTLTNGVTAATIKPYSNFDLSSVAGLGSYEGRVVFASQCGDACAAFDVDNIVVQYLEPATAEPATAVPSLSHIGIVVLAVVLLSLLTLQLRSRRLV